MPPVSDPLEVLVQLRAVLGADVLAPRALGLIAVPVDPQDHTVVVEQSLLAQFVLDLHHVAQAGHNDPKTTLGIYAR